MFQKKIVSEKNKIDSVLDYTVDSITQIMFKTTRFPKNVGLDELIRQEIHTLSATICKNKTIAGTRIPSVVLKIMEKTNCDYALAISYEYWDRSGKNL